MMCGSDGDKMVGTSGNGSSSVHGMTCGDVNNAAVGEGFFGVDGNNFWNLIGRVGGGAVRMVGGLPT